MKKRIFIGIGILVAIILLGLFLFFFNLRGLKQNEVIDFEVKAGESTSSIISTLKSQNLIRSTFYTKLFMYLSGKTSLKAGDYSLNKNMSAQDIINKLYIGDVIDNSITITFLEGKRFTDYMALIANKFNYNEDDLISTLNDETYLNSLMQKYWFLKSTILDKKIYYPLEGYLYPDTYTFKNDATIKEIVEKMLDNMEQKLSSYEDDINNSKLSFHQLLTLASIVELEAGSLDDRLNVAGVFYNRLNNNWSLGSDVTTYYAAKKDFTEELTQVECLECNAYNTRSTCLIGLPIGPIDSPSIEAIQAAVNPQQNDYFFFVADINKKVYFSKTSAEQANVIATLKSENLWYNY